MSHWLKKNNMNTPGLGKRTMILYRELLRSVRMVGGEPQRDWKLLLSLTLFAVFVVVLFSFFLLVAVSKKADTSLLVEEGRIESIKRDRLKEVVSLLEDWRQTPE